MTYKHSACAVGLDNDQDGDKEIFVLGGKSGNNVFLRSVDVFDIDTRVWSTIPDMAQPRWGLGCAAAAGKIFAVGGKQHLMQYQDTMEVYTPGHGPVMNFAFKKVMTFAFKMMTVAFKMMNSALKMMIVHLNDGLWGRWLAAGSHTRQS